MKENNAHSEVSPTIQHVVDRLGFNTGILLGTVSVSSTPLTAAFNTVKRRYGLNKIAELIAPALGVVVTKDESLPKKLVKIALAAQEKGYDMKDWAGPLPQLQAIVEEAEKSQAGRWKTLAITHRYLQDRKHA